MRKKHGKNDRRHHQQPIVLAVEAVPEEAVAVVVVARRTIPNQMHCEMFSLHWKMHRMSRQSTMMGHQTAVPLHMMSSTRSRVNRMVSLQLVTAGIWSQMKKICLVLLTILIWSLVVVEQAPAAVTTGSQ